MAATDKSRQTCLASTRTPTPIVVLKFMVLSFQQIVVNVSIPRTTSDTFKLTIRLNIPTIQALESHKITTNNPTTTEKDQQQQLQALVSFVNPNIIFLQQWNLPVAISPSPDIHDKQSLPLQIPSPGIIRVIQHNTVQAHNQQLQVCQSVHLRSSCLQQSNLIKFMRPHRHFEYGTHSFSSEAMFIINLTAFNSVLLHIFHQHILRKWNQQIVAATINTSSQPTINNPTTTEKDQQQQLQALVSFVNPNIISLQQWNLSVAISPSPDIRDKQSLPLQIPSPDKITCKPHNDPTITMTARCFLCNHKPSDRAPAPRSDPRLVRQFVSLKSRRSSSIPRKVPQIRNKSSKSYNSTSELPNDPETFLFVSTTSLCRFSALCPLTDLLQPRDHEDHNPTAPSPIPL